MNNLRRSIVFQANLVLRRKCKQRLLVSTRGRTRVFLSFPLVTTGSRKIVKKCFYHALAPRNYGKLQRASPIWPVRIRIFLIQNSQTNIMQPERAVLYCKIVDCEHHRLLERWTLNDTMRGPLFYFLFFILFTLVCSSNCVIFGPLRRENSAIALTRGWFYRAQSAFRVQPYFPCHIDRWWFSVPSVDDLLVKEFKHSSSLCISPWFAHRPTISGSSDE